MAKKQSTTTQLMNLVNKLDAFDFSAMNLNKLPEDFGSASDFTTHVVKSLNKSKSRINAAQKTFDTEQYRDQFESVFGPLISQFNGDVAGAFAFAKTKLTGEVPEEFNAKSTAENTENLEETVTDFDSDVKPVSTDHATYNQSRYEHSDGF